MLYFIRKYPFSLVIILAATYLSFFQPPSMDDEPLFLWPHFDKLVIHGKKLSVYDMYSKSERTAVSRRRPL